MRIDNSCLHPIKVWPDTYYITESCMLFQCKAFDKYLQFSEINRNIKIVESGSNSNGNYRKYSDGTIEMWGEAAFANIAINNKDNWNYYSNQLTVNLPCASVSIPKITGTVRNDSGAWLSIPGRGLGYDLFRAWVYASSPVTSQNVWIVWHAFGTWK